MNTMDGTDLRQHPFAMPATSPAYPPGPYRFVNREYFIIRYRTDPLALRRVVPEPLEITEPVVNYEFIRMPDRSEEHTSELQSLMRISYAVFCLKKKNIRITIHLTQ